MANLNLKGSTFFYTPCILSNTASLTDDIFSLCKYLRNESVLACRPQVAVLNCMLFYARHSRVGTKYKTLLYSIDILWNL